MFQPTPFSAKQTRLVITRVSESQVKPCHAQISEQKPAEKQNFLLKCDLPSKFNEIYFFNGNDCFKLEFFVINTLLFDFSHLLHFNTHNR
jgi:hypothetical protein